MNDLALGADASTQLLPNAFALTVVLDVVNNLDCPPTTPSASTFLNPHTILQSLPPPPPPPPPSSAPTPYYNPAPLLPPLRPIYVALVELLPPCSTIETPSAIIFCPPPLSPMQDGQPECACRCYLREVQESTAQALQHQPVTAHTSLMCLLVLTIALSQKT